MLTGSRGFIGRRLVAALEAGGHEVLRALHEDWEGVAHRAPHPNEVLWNEHGFADLSLLEGLDAVVHLAGESIEGRWSEDKKTAIICSRMRGTRALCESLRRLKRKPSVLVAASAVGYYGDTGDRIVDESQPPGDMFLSRVAQYNESAADAAAALGIRTVTARFGMVLDADEGALTRMLPIFRMGLGGKFAKGRQYWSWIHIEDAIAAVMHILNRSDIFGPVNVTSPNPVTNEDFARTLAGLLGRPSLMSVPGPVARMFLGQMAQELLLTSCRAIPLKLLESGFTLRYPILADALENLLIPRQRRKVA